MASSPITSWQIVGETMGTVTDFIFEGAPKSLQMVTEAKKLKSIIVFTVSPTICHEVMGADAMILVF